MSILFYQVSSKSQSAPLGRYRYRTERDKTGINYWLRTTPNSMRLMANQVTLQWIMLSENLEDEPWAEYWIPIDVTARRTECCTLWFNTWTVPVNGWLSISHSVWSVTQGANIWSFGELLQREKSIPIPGGKGIPVQLSFNSMNYHSSAGSSVDILTVWITKCMVLYECLTKILEYKTAIWKSSINKSWAQ